MNKKLKYSIIVAVVVIVIYIAYRFFKKPKEVKDVVKQPLQTESGNIKEVTSTQLSTGTINGINLPMSSGSTGAVVIDLKSGKPNVSDLTNGLDADKVGTIEVQQPLPRVKYDLSLGPVVVDKITDQPKVSDLTNGLNADIAP